VVVVLQDGCQGQPVLQGLPQDTQHLAWAAYDQNTPCADVVQATERPNSYGERIKLEFANTSSLLAQGLTYHVCSDVTWMQLNGTEEEELGPVDTYLWFYNPCSAPKTVTFNISRLADGKKKLLPDREVLCMVVLRIPFTCP
jgi:hypothetical protein